VLIELASGRRIIFKQAKPASPFDFELSMLTRLEASPFEGLLPRVLAAFPESRALLLEFVGSRDTRAALRAGSDPGTAALAIGEALRAYHSETGLAFGDFHPANVILSGTTVRFIDPAPPAWHEAPTGEDPLVTDLALWTYSTTANVLWDARRSPRLAWRMLVLNVTLLREAQAASTAGFHSKVRAQAWRHLRELWKGWPRDKVVFVVASGLSLAVVEASRIPARRSRSAAQFRVEVVTQAEGQREERESHSSGAASRHH